MLAEINDGQWLSYYGPVPRDFVRAALGLTAEAWMAVLPALLTGGGFVADVFTKETGEAEICGRENFQRLLALDRRTRRPEFTLLPVTMLSLFPGLLIGHREKRDIHGDLQDHLERLFGYVSQAGLWDAAGKEHPLRLPGNPEIRCRRWVGGDTNIAVFQEILYRYFSIKRREVGLQVFNVFARIMQGTVLPVQHEDMILARMRPDRAENAGLSPTMLQTEWFFAHEFGTLSGLTLFVGNIGAVLAAPPLGLMYPLLFFLGFFGSAFVLTWACAKEMNPPEIAGLATGTANAGGFLGLL